MNKYIICSLLVLTLISTQSINTYAWFTDNETLHNDLIINMGTLNVEVNEGFYRDTIDKDKKRITKEFKITNVGTLNQKLSLEFSQQGLDTLDDKYTKGFNYKLEIVDQQGNKHSIKFNLKDKKKIDLKDKEGNPIILSSGDSLNCKSIMSIKQGASDNVLENISDKSIHFNIDVLASQISYKNSGNSGFEHIGFTDEETQVNLVYVDKLIDSGLSGSLEVEFDDDDTEIEIDIPEEEYEDKGWKLKEVDILGGTGEFHHVDIDMNDNGTPDVDDDEFDIVKLPLGLQFNTNQIGNTFTDNQKLIVELIFFDKKNENNATKKLVEKWEIKFRIIEIDGEKVLDAFYTVLESEETTIDLSQEALPTEPEVVEPPKEEVEVPSEPEIIETHKEEQVLPVEPDVVKSSKEDEIEIEE